MNVYQSQLPTYDVDQSERTRIYRERLVALLSQDLDFHSQDSGYASHNFHSFPAKFPPQLPRKFIKALTAPGDIVLDPMMGSGTTVLETFFELAFSAIIITKSGGVSLAFDLAHTRPHQAKVVIDRHGKAVLGSDLVDSSSRRIKLLTKTLRSPLKEFEKRFQQNVDGLLESESGRLQPYLTGLLEPEPDTVAPYIMLGNPQSLPLDNSSIELQESILEIENEDQMDMLTILIEGRRLRDISDLPFDLAT